MPFLVENDTLADKYLSGNYVIVTFNFLGGTVFEPSYYYFTESSNNTRIFSHNYRRIVILSDCNLKYVCVAGKSRIIVKYFIKFLQYNDKQSERPYVMIIGWIANH